MWAHANAHISFANEANFGPNENYSFEMKDIQDCINQDLTEYPTLPHDESLKVMQSLVILRSQRGLKYESQDAQNNLKDCSRKGPKIWT